MPGQSLDGSYSPFSTLSTPGATTSGTTPSTDEMDNWFICRVQCLYDFESDDPDHLPFHKNEILTIVKQEESGWWAAIRPPGDRIGWIPSGFVEPIIEDGPPSSAGRASEPERQNSYPVSASFESQNDVWVPVKDGQRLPSLQLVTSPDLISRGGMSANQMSPTSFFNIVDDLDSPSQLRPPPSPMSAVPKPPQLPWTPLTPANLHHRRAHSATASIQCSHTAPIKTQHGRHIRPLPVIMGNGDTVTRLSAIMGSYASPMGYELLSSPNINESLDSLSRSRCNSFRSKRLPDLPSRAQTPKKQLPTPPPQSIEQQTPSYELQTERGVVKAGTLRALVQKLTSESSGPQDVTFRETFLLTFRTFTTPHEFFSLLVARFDMAPPPNISARALEMWRERELRPVQNRVMTVLSLWVQSYHIMQEEPILGRKLSNFLTGTSIPPQMSRPAKALLNSISAFKADSFETPMASPLTPATPVMPVTPSLFKRPKYSLNDMCRWNPDEIAEHLCVIEQRLYAAIRPEECFCWTRTQQGREVSNIVAFMNAYKKVSSWVKMSILSQDSLSKRVATIDFWIQVADKCRDVQNYHSLSAIVTGLSSQVVTKLHHSWKQSSRRAQFESHSKLCDSASDFATFFCVMKRTEGPCTPILRMSLAELVSVDKAMEDTVEVQTSAGPIQCINFAKRQRFANIVGNLLRQQPNSYPYIVVEATRTFMMSQMNMAGAKESSWFWTRSEKLQASESSRLDVKGRLDAAGIL